MKVGKPRDFYIEDDTEKNAAGEEELEDEDGGDSAPSGAIQFGGMLFVTLV